MEKIAIIGAGMAGLTAARALAGAGLSVTVFDKSRGVGGRLATRRGAAGSFDHGAPLAQGRTEAFDAAMATLDASARQVAGGWHGRPGMSGLLKPWLEGVTHVPGCRIARVVQDNGAIRLTDVDGVDKSPFDAVIVAIPAPQVADLLPEAGPIRASMSPVWTLIARWDGATDTPRTEGTVFDQIIAQRDGEGWVAHASASWSAGNLERDAADVATDLSGHLGAALRADAAPVHAVAHRWRFARVAAPLGVPFLRVGPGVLAGGDWALGTLAGDAWRSGRAMAADLLGETR